MKIAKLKIENCLVRGNIAGGARKNLEKRLGRSIVSKGNFKKLPESKDKIETKKKK